MQEREKQIEEMKYDICTAADYCYGACEECNLGRLAEHLYNAGYRKQSEGEWIDRFKGEFINPIYVCSLCGKGTLLKPHINELRNMEMEQALSPFCPNCGAKMKGGGE
jgi:hypothetical protein